MSLGIFCQTLCILYLFSCGVWLHWKLYCSMCLLIAVGWVKSCLEVWSLKRELDEGSSLATSTCVGMQKEGPVSEAVPLFSPIWSGWQLGQVLMSNDTLSPFHITMQISPILSLVLHVVRWMVIFMKCSDMYCLIPLISWDSSMTIISTSPFIQTHALPVTGKATAY